jgi:hypothetical protein
VSLPILSIVIPTRNRPAQVKATLTNLKNVIPPSLKIEILVSDNSDNPLDLGEFKSEVICVRPPQILQTAEENLAFVLKEASGIYVWPLGDDDVILKTGFEKLVSECLLGRYDGFTMNTRNVSSDYRAMGWSRVMCFENKIELSYDNFLERIGYWSIPAGISLTVFKRELINNEVLGVILNSDSKIYSHVTMYAMMFNSKSFAFINTDLVEYRTNLYDVSHQSTDHWTAYSSSLGKNDRFFWLTGFIHQLQFLERHSAIKPNYIARAIDIGHFNHRLPLLEHMFSMLLDQISLDLNGKSKISMKSQEVTEIIEYFESKEPSLLGYYNEVTELYKSNKTIEEKKNLINELQQNWSMERTSYPYRRFYRTRAFGFFIYETPMGWLALPQETSSTNFSVPSVNHLDLMLLGIDIPRVRNIYTAESYEALSFILKDLDLDLNFFQDVLEFQLAPARFKQLNNNKKVTLVRKLWLRLPLRMKIYLKRSLSGK